MRVADNMAVFCGFLLAAAPVYPTAHAALLYNTGMTACLAAQNGQTGNFTPVVLSPCTGTFAEQWMWDGQTIQGPGTLCLDRYFAGKTPGTPVDIFPCNGTPAQNWLYSGSAIIDPATGLCLSAGGVNQQLTMQTCNIKFPAGAYWSIN